MAFFAPFLGCTALAYYLLGWTVKSSWLAGVALSTTSVAQPPEPIDIVEMDAIIDSATQHYE